MAKTERIYYERFSKPFSERFRTTLKRNGLNQRQASEILKVPLGTVEAWLAGSDKSWGREPDHLTQAGVFQYISNFKSNQCKDLPCRRKKNKNKWEILTPTGEKIVAFTLLKFIKDNFDNENMAKWHIYTKREYMGYKFKKLDDPVG